jgi:hypothetical protein
MRNDLLAGILQGILDTSLHPERYDDDIQPSKRQNYDGDKIATQLQLLINILKIEDDE